MDENENWYTFDLRRIEARLADVELQYRAEAGSTNDWARRVAPDTDSHRTTLFLAQRQTAGRGRGDRRWESSSGSLTFSVLMPCADDFQDQTRSLLSLAAGCGVCDALRQYGLDVWLKWPNDVICDQHKLAGILVESIEADRVIVGCGINVNNDVAAVTAAISMRDHRKSGFNISDVLVQVVAAIIERVESVGREPAILMDDLRQYDWLLGKTVRVNGATEMTGMAIGIADDGALLIDAGSKEVAVYSGSIFVVDRNS